MDKICEYIPSLIFYTDENFFLSNSSFSNFKENETLILDFNGIRLWFCFEVTMVT